MKQSIDQLNNSNEYVSVLLCTFNGEKFLAAQLDSIYNQDHKNITVWVSDDGSTDNTAALLKKYQAIFGNERFHIISGPQKGFAANFLALATRAELTGDYFAYSDQDDIWEKDKVSRAISKLKSMPQTKPLLYCSRSRLVDQHNNDMGLTKNYIKKPSFANALVQNIASGNTMVFNKVAHDLLVKYSNNLTVAYHDWWTYILITAVDGEVFYDTYPGVRYRQHANNQFGSNMNFLSNLLRLKFLLDGKFKKWNTSNVAAIKNTEHALSAKNKSAFDLFYSARQCTFFPRIIGLLKSGIHRQKSLDNLGLFVAALLNRI